MLLSESYQQVDFKKKGSPRTSAIAYRLCQELEKLQVSKLLIYHSKHKVSVQTADIYQAALETYDTFKFVLQNKESADILTPGGQQNDQNSC